MLATTRYMGNLRYGFEDYEMYLEMNDLLELKKYDEILAMLPEYRLRCEEIERKQILVNTDSVSDTTDPKTYLFFVQRCLHMTAEMESEQYFDRFLNTVSSMDLIYEDAKNDVMWSFPNQIDGECFITRKEKYLEKIVDRFGITNSKNKYTHFSINDKVYVTDAPGVYIAILRGDMKMVRFYERHGSNLAIKNEGPFFLKRNYRDEGFFFNALTASVLSGELEMIQYIAEKNEFLPWNEQLGWAVAMADSDITQFMIQKYPKLIKKISLIAIIESGNDTLLNLFINNHLKDDSLHVLLQNFFDGKEKKFFYDRKNRKELARFFHILFDYACEGGERKTVLFCLLNAMLMLDDCYPDSPLAELFYTYKKKDTEDYTDVFVDLFLTYRDQVIALFEILLKKRNFEKFSINMHDMHEKMGDKLTRGWLCCDIFSNAKSVNIFCRALQPIEIHAETDFLCDYVIENGMISGIKSLIKHGFITSVNVDAVYTEALKCEKVNERIVIELLKLSGKTNLSERYNM